MEGFSASRNQDPVRPGELTERIASEPDTREPRGKGGATQVGIKLDRPVALRGPAAGVSIGPVSQLEAAAFWELVDKSGDCWLWRGAINRGGYGTVRISGKTRYAHRVGFLLGTGQEPPPGHPLDHLCRTKLCVRGTHLEPVRQDTNVRRGDLATLDEDQVRQIRRLLASGARQAEVRRRFGLTKQTVWDIASGRSWRGVQP